MGIVLVATLLLGGTVPLAGAPALGPEDHALGQARDAGVIAAGPGTPMSDLIPGAGGHMGSADAHHDLLSASAATRLPSITTDYTGPGVHTFPADPRPPGVVQVADLTEGPVPFIVCQDTEGDCSDSPKGIPRIETCGTTADLRPAHLGFRAEEPTIVEVLPLHPGCPYQATTGTITLTWGRMREAPRYICDSFDTAWLAVLDLGPGLSPHQTGGAAPIGVTGNGASPTVVCRSDVQGDPDDPFIDTEIVQLDLIADHPILGVVEVRASPAFESRGRIENLAIDAQGRLCGDSWFDVYFELSNRDIRRATDDGWIRNLDPFRVGPNRICNLPPVKDGFYGKIDLGPIALFGTFQGEQFIFGFAVAGAHKPLPPFDPGRPDHAIMAVADAELRLTDADCRLPILDLSLADASVPPHGITSARIVSVGGLPPLTLGLPLWLAGPFADPEGDGIWSARLLIVDLPCEAPSIEVEATYADGHTTRATVAVPLV